MDPLSRGRRLVELSLAKSRAVVKRALVKAADNPTIACPVKRPKVLSSGVLREMPGPSSSTPFSPTVLGISEIVNSVLEKDPELTVATADSPTKLPGIPPADDAHEALRPLSSTPVHPTFWGISEIVSDLLENEPEFMTNCSFSMIPADDDGCDLNSTKFEQISGPYIMGDDSSISERVRSYSQVSQEQLFVKESATNVKEKTCIDPIPSVSSGEFPGTSGMNYQVVTEGLRRSEEMVLEGDKCVLLRDGGEGSQNGDYGVERRERETGMDENTSGLSEEAIADEPNGDEARGVRKKKIGKSNWKRNQVLRRRENGDEYLGRSKKSDKIPARSLGRRCSCKKGGYQCMEIGDDDREKIFKYVWSLTWEQKRTFVTSLIEKDDVARRTVSLVSESEVGVFRKQNTFSYFLKAPGGQRKKVCRNFFLSTTGLRRWCVRDWIMNERSTRKVREQGLSSRKADRKFCVDEFFNLLPRLPSHYCRASSSKLYLEPLFQSFADVYNLYLTKCKEKHRRPLSRQVLKKIFDELNLALFHPRKDQCDVCVGYNCGNVDEQVWLMHRERKEGAQSTKSADKETAIISLNSAGDKTFVCCMDF